MSRIKTLSIAMDQTTKEMIGYWTPQNGIGAIVVRADNERLLQRKFERALRHYHKKFGKTDNKNSFFDKSRSPKKQVRKVARKLQKVRNRATSK
jgi:hypothetical protein